MADTAKPVEVKETVPVVAEPVVEAAPAVETPAATEATAAAVDTEATPATEEAKKEEEEKAPVEAGVLSHKGEGANFPKNLFAQKKFFWFGSDAVDVKAIPTFKADKAAEVAHHVTSWAAETGKGLLFFGEKQDKTAPHGAIQLAEATEPATDGSHKFHLVSKGHKHTFKAATTVERDQWVAQIKAKIEEAKALAATVTESETYKKTLEALKPAPPAKKEEKAAEPVAETAPVATEEVAAPAATTEAAAVTEAPVEEAKKEETVEKEESKRRSASRKRASIFGSVFGKKEEKKVEATETEATPTAETTTAPAVETPAAEPVAEPVEAAAAPVVETPETKTEETVEAKPVVAKRQSLFGNLSFGKKKVASPEPTPVAETPATTEAVAETAPVIPAVETSEPLSAEVSSPATVPTETVEATPATNGETKKEVKSEKRKSSLPFVGAFGKKDKSASSDEEGDKPKSPSRFSKLRATIKGKKAEKVDEKTEETAAPAAETSAAVEPTTEETSKPVEPEVTAPATEEAPKPVQPTPVVSAAA